MHTVGTKSTRNRRTVKCEKYLKVVTPWGIQKGIADGAPNTMGMRICYERVVLGISLLLECLETHAVDCGDVIVII